MQNKTQMKYRRLTAFIMLCALVSAHGNEMNQAQVNSTKHVDQAIGELIESNRDAITKHRTVQVQLLLRPKVAAKVTQIKHDFWFGTALNRELFREEEERGGKGFSAKDKAMYKQIVLENFNSAVHENALKWQCTEVKKGEVDYTLTDRVADWCITNELRLRGHTVFYPQDNYIQKWIKELDDKELHSTLNQRATSVMTHFKGRITEYDVNNEMLNPKSYFKGRLGESIRPEMFKWCRDADPDAILYMNDNGILNFGNYRNYAKQIQQLIDQGAPIGGIGVQGHFFTPEQVNPKTIGDALDRLSQFNLPIKVTEFDISTPDEVAKAKGLATVYTMCFAHPSVEGILMWGFWQGKHWRPTAFLWKNDWTPTLAAETYQRLVFKEWWTRWNGVAGLNGQAELRAFFGEQRVEVDGKSRSFYLSPSEKSVMIDCRDPDPAKWVKRVSKH